MRFLNQVILITGGNRGLGLATAQHFKAEGAQVALMARDGQTGEDAARRLGAVFIAGDVRIASDCERAVGETLNAYGRLDVLVNAAGIILRNRTVEQTTQEEWEAILDTNLKGTFLMSKLAMPALRETKGNIVNVSSYTGLVGFRGSAAYAASKAAIINLTRTMALDHAREQIRVNCVCPGSIDTDMLHEAWKLYGDVAEAQRLWAAKHPLGRIATPDEVARAIAFLASAEAGFITGVALPVDGGLTAE